MKFLEFKSKEDGERVSFDLSCITGFAETCFGTILYLYEDGDVFCVDLRDSYDDVKAVIMRCS